MYVCVCVCVYKGRYTLQCDGSRSLIIYVYSGYQYLLMPLKSSHHKSIKM